MLSARALPRGSNPCCSFLVPAALLDSIAATFLPKRDIRPGHAYSKFLRTAHVSLKFKWTFGRSLLRLSLPIQLVRILWCEAEYGRELRRATLFGWQLCRPRCRSKIQCVPPTLVWPKGFNSLNMLPLSLNFFTDSPTISAQFNLSQISLLYPMSSLHTTFKRPVWAVRCHYPSQWLWSDS